ncbi:MAG: FAD-binding oxidoreductase [Phycisphaerae bacterium]
MIDETLIAELEPIVGSDALVCDADERLVYEADAFTLARNTPDLVVLPSTGEQVAAIVRVLARRGVPFVPRGAGTGLAGGAATRPGAVMISVNRLRQIRRIDLRNRLAEVEAGVINLSLSRAVAEHDLHFAPDPSSQQACSIGGNASTNAGGPHTLKYGVTVNHVRGLELVLPDGTLVRTGGDCADLPGLDLTGVIVGSEGTFGVITACTVRLTPRPAAVRTLLAIFDAVDGATQTVSDVVAAGIVPAAMEMMDRAVLAAVEAAYHVGFPADAGAALIVELDGVEAGLDAAMQRVAELCKRNGARSTRVAASDDERALLWKSRKRAAGALGRITTSYCTQDGVVPRSELPELMREIAAIAKQHALRIANLVHAGDGNIHPILMYDERDAGEVRRVLAASHEILAACIRRGGTITGEHGVGVEKLDFMPLLFSPSDLATMTRLRAVFNPQGLCNPHKMFPDTKGCWELHKPGKRAPV